MPVSISSKMTVGSSVESVMMDLRASIMRDISPPEATLLRSAGSTPLLALKRMLIRSMPEGCISVSCSRRISMRLSGIPNWDRRCPNSFWKAGMAFCRLFESWVARLRAACSACVLSRSNSCSRSSLSDCCVSSCRSFSANSNSPDTLSTWYLCCKVYMRSMRSLSRSSSAGLTSTSLSLREIS